MRPCKLNMMEYGQIRISETAEMKDEIRVK